MAGNKILDMNLTVSQGDEVQRKPKEEFGNTSESENVLINEVDDKQLKRKRNHRHTPEQIQEMEAFFKECPHPNKKQREELGNLLGMEPLQVKFWFQNKRTQMKTKYDRRENTRLRAVNKELQAENMHYREVLSNARCVFCAGMLAVGDMSSEEYKLRMENAKLRQQIDQISAVAFKYAGKPFTNSGGARSFSTSFPVDVGATDETLDNINGEENHNAAAAAAAAAGF